MLCEVSERAERLAANEAVFRAGNDAIEANTSNGRAGELVVLCECGTEACFERIALTREEYEAVREHPARFFVIPGHEDLSTGEVVVEAESNRYSVVEKRGEGRRVAERTNPRA